MKRVLSIFFGAIAVLGLGLILVLGTSAYWLPWAAPRLLALAGVEVESAHRSAGGEFVLAGVQFSDPALELSLDEFRSPMPLSLLWHGIRHNPGMAGRVHVQGIRILLLESDAPAESSAEAPGPSVVMEDVENWMNLADRWLPPVSVRDFSLTVAGSAEAYELSTASFQSRTLTAQSVARSDLPSATLSVSLPADDPWGIQLSVDDWKLHLVGSWAATANGARLEGQIERDTGGGPFALEWGEDSWMPAVASLSVSKFLLPEELELIPDEIGSVAIDSLTLNWDGADYSLGAAIRGGKGAEELALNLSLMGNLQEVILGNFSVDGSWAHLNLQEAVRFDLKTLEAEAPFRFTASADLSKQDYYPAAGVLNGELEAEVDSEGRYPVRFSLRGKDLLAEARSLGDLSLRGSFEYPSVAVEELRIDLPRGSVAQVVADADLEEQIFSAQLTGELSGNEIDALAGTSTGLDGSLRMQLSAQGPFLKPKHSGEVEADSMVPPGVVPLDLSLAWEGVGLEKLSADLKVATKSETITTRLETVREGELLRGRIVNWAWSRGGQSFLTLEEPAEVRVDLSTLGKLPWAGLEVGKIALNGEGRMFAFSWNPPTTASLRVEGLQAQDLAGWMESGESLPLVSLELFALEIADFEPVLIADFAADATWSPDDDEPVVEVQLQGELEESGVQFSKIFAGYGGTPLIGGEIGIPLVFNPAVLAPLGPETHGVPVTTVAETPQPFWKVLSDGELSGSLQGKWSPELRQKIQTLGGGNLEGADLALSLSGTVENPEAHLSLNLDSINLEKEWVGDDFPKIRKLAVDLFVDAEKIALTQGVLELRDSGINVTAELPYPALWQDYLNGVSIDVWKVLESLEANAELNNWKAAVWKDRLPILLRPQGKITGKVGVQPGLNLEGRVKVGDFSIRPTLYSSPVDDIHADLLFEGKQVRLEDAGAAVGGGSVSLAGFVDFEDLLDPRYQLVISGENVPIARTTDMILRSDVDLKFAREAGEDTPILSGELNLRNSTYLISFDPFSPNIETGPGTQPPYFSVPEQPFADWRLDVMIEGNNFLRVRSSIFSTELSAALHLTRTLGDPLLLGSVRANSGRIRFPGMGMRIESVEAFIAPEEPNLLQIEADAIGQNRTYVITMNASGSTENPQIQFSSTPNLTSAQIVRILATGSLEGGGAGAIGLYLGQALMGPGNGEDTLADRLSVKIGQEVTESGSSTVDVVYKLNDLWSVEGEYDRYDTYNLNLVRILLER